MGMECLIGSEINSEVVAWEEASLLWGRRQDWWLASLPGRYPPSYKQRKQFNGQSPTITHMNHIQVSKRCMFVHASSAV